MRPSDLLPDTMRRREHILVGEQRGTAVELAVVHNPSHPGVPVDSGGKTAHDSILLVGTATFCKVDAAG